MRQAEMLLAAVFILLAAPHVLTFDSDMMFEEGTPAIPLPDPAGLKPQGSPGLLARLKRGVWDLWSPFKTSTLTSTSTSTSTSAATTTTSADLSTTTQGRSRETWTEEPLPTPVQHHLSTRETRRTEEERYGRTSQVTSDDEDLVTSGDVPGETESPITDHHVQRKVFRVSLSVFEPWQQEFFNPMTQEFQQFAQELTQEVDNLYKDLDGQHSSKVVGIQKTEDNFYIKVSFDVVSSSSASGSELRNRMERVLETYKLGKFSIRADQFKFRDFTDVEICPSPKLTCVEDGESCYEVDQKCNRNNDCPDGSDELDCVYHLYTTVSKEEGGERREDNKCRADEEEVCADNRTVICAVNICDGVVDCPGGDDEHDCPSNKPECGIDEFMCDMSRCVSRSSVCDGNSDCSDGTDEIYCHEDTHKNIECGADQKRCQDGSCYPRNGTCNYHRDCPDGSDELDCRYCAPGEFRCYSGECLHQERKCNGRKDCPEGEDERHCRGECSSGMFSCSDGTCIRSVEECDGRQDCPDGTDEDHCTSEPVHDCLQGEFKCSDGVCIQESFRCDGLTDCQDRSDELDCPSRCGPQDDLCSDGTCVASSKKCDGVSDCRDNSDENNCRVKCDESQFECRSGECISVKEKCDGSYQCRDGSDESNCQCSSNELSCDGTRCISKSLVCDGKRDCNDGTDEPYYCRDRESGTRAPGPDPGISCSSWQFRCLSRTQCIEKNRLCDGRDDCNDGSDEENCAGTPDLNLKTYPPEQTIKESREVVFQCRDEGLGHIPVRWVRAENLPLPHNSRDHNGRLEMPNIQVSHSGTYYCEAVGVSSSKPGARVPVYLNVEPFAPVRTRPTEGCGPDQATCYNRQCIPKRNVCDGHYDCGDGSDETRCNVWGCEPNEFQCENNKCVRKSWRCDSDDDCGDGSDERECQAQIPGSRCHMNEFECRSRDQCIPKWFHCDSQNDCQDGSDEIGCYPLQIKQPPPPMVILDQGERLVITCLAVGVPTPVVSWRLNWNHIPSKCTTTSVNGLGTLTCPDIQESDQGAYSCEAMDSRHSIIAQPDTHLKVKVTDVSPLACPSGSFNDLAKSPQECITCFCFGATTDCKSADLFVYQLQPPLYSSRLVNVEADPSGTSLDIRKNEESSVQSSLRADPDGRGFEIASRNTGSRDYENVYPYFPMPENYHGNQLKSYGGYLHFTVKFDGSGEETDIPDLILTGNGYTLTYKLRRRIGAGEEEDVSIQLIRGDWKKIKDGRWTYAKREDMMMALVSVDNILIRTQYLKGSGIETKISNIQMDSASVSNTGKGQAALVEECRCPTGYTGLSCEQCAPGYLRRESSLWLGTCYKEYEVCPPGTFGDPSRGIPCQRCPCPLTSPGNQFGRTCRLGSDGQVTCDCPPGYVGRRCERCDSGYTGNPLQAGDYCRPGGECDPDGSESLYADPTTGLCRCKEYTTGPLCNQCKEKKFFLSGANPYGCISCFCMGVTEECSSSNWYRDQVDVHFTRDSQDVELVASDDDLLSPQPPISVRFDRNNQQLVHDQFEPKVYYWKLPGRFLGDKVTAYGGNLSYTLSYTPTPGGQSSRNTAADVHLHSLNKIHLEYFNRETVEGDRPVTVHVPILEDYWQREDGTKTDREHLLEALADVSDIFIKATYTTNTREASLKTVRMDIATPRNTGQERAIEVEQCQCPVGYRGLSCEDCDAGYTRVDEGLYLGLCEPCSCNDFSNECHPETGACINCRDNRGGEKCEQCQPGFTEVDGRCEDDRRPCECDRRGSASSDCVDGRCRCKTNVIGDQCDRCRAGTFSLTEENPSGCLQCYCSGVTTGCQSSNMYREEIPAAIINDQHGFSLTRGNRTESITGGFIIDIATNEIGYDLSTVPERGERYFWSLPSQFTGDKVTSYGGKLTYTQKYQASYDAYPTPDQDIIISGNGLSLFWSFDDLLRPDRRMTLSVPLEEGKWHRLDARSGHRLATRQEILKVLSNVEAILVRASLSSSITTSHLSDVIMETAVPQRRGTLAKEVEVCRCPPQYKGTSCELCAEHYYRDYNELCKRCPCSNNEETCVLGPDYKVRCTCKPGFSGQSCEVDNPAGASTSAPPPDDRPVIDITITEPAIQIVEKGSTVRYTCQGLSPTQRTVRVKWSREGGQLPPGRAVDDSYGLLVIRAVEESDSGVYICTASDGYSTNTKYVQLTVGRSESRRPVARVFPSYIETREGDPVELRCEATGYPLPSIQWFRTDGKPLPSKAVVYNGKLRLQTVTRYDDGQYECRANNEAGSASARTVLYVQERPRQLPLKVSPRRASLLIGESLTITCSVSSPHDTYKLEWRRENSRGLGYGTTSSNGILNIYSASESDAGTYYCTATSETTGERLGEVETVVDVSSTGSPPVVEVEPERQTVPQGRTAELRCKVTGENPKITWTKSGQPLPPSSQINGAVLRIPSIQVSDRGIYICSAETSGGHSNKPAILEVERREPPVVQLYPSAEQVLEEGNSVQIQCIVTQGTPSPKVYWLRAGNVSLPYSVQQLSDNVLRINSVRFSDAGEYVCRAENLAGATSATATLVIRSPPRVTLVPRGVQELQVGETLRLECRATGEPTPSVYWTRRFRGQAFLPKTEQSGRATLEVFSVEPEDEGIYLCVASNSAGTEEQEIEVRVQDNSVPTRGDQTGVDAGKEDDGDIILELGSYNDPIECFLEEAGPKSGSVRLEWRRKDGRRMGQNISQRNGTLYINDAQKSDEGIYSCVGVDSSGRTLFQKSRTIRVISLPRISLKPPKQVVRPGDDPYVVCSATGDPPIEITWEAIDRPMPRTATTNAGYLQFQGITESEAGRYVCKATNNVGVAEAIAEVIIGDNEVVQVTAVERDQDIYEGAPITLRCKTGEPTAMEWSREGGDLPYNSRQEGGNLMIMSPKVEDSGRYVCTAVSSRGYSSNDYINLRVNQRSGGRCIADGEFECLRWGECIPVERICDKVVDCRDASDESEAICGSNYRRLRGVSHVELKIQPSIDVISIGDTVDLRCITRGVSNPTLHWTKVGDQLPSNVQLSSNLLRITEVTTKNAGQYRCTAKTPTGLYEDDFILKVKGVKMLHDDAAIETKPATEGKTVILNCKTVLEPPVLYKWSKERSSLPSKASHHQETLSIPNVALSDAGMYVCKASNGEVRMDILTILTVSGSFPSFGGNSYLQLPPITSAYLVFNMEIFFKPDQPTGLILYEGQNPGPDGDFIALGLRNRVPEFSFNVGSGTAVIAGSRNLELGKWHSVKIVRDRKSVKMWVDGEGPYEGESKGRSQGLDLLLPLYIGAVPHFESVQQKTGFSSGFVGCISKVEISNDDKLGQKRNAKSYLVGRCETCEENPCSNNGVCQEAVNMDGYTCICPRGYSGHDCTKIGESCYPGVCGSGECRDTESGVKCKCPLNFVGKRCEEEVTIAIPSFSENSYMAYPTPRTTNKLKVTLKFNPVDSSDALLLYSSQSDYGTGDFVSLSIKDRRVEFRFDTGSGDVVLRSDTPVRSGEWTTITAGWDHKEAHLVMAEEVINLPISQGQRRDLNLRTPLFVGGRDEKVRLNPTIQVSRGFRGCISQIDLHGHHLNLIDSVIDSSGIDVCSLNSADPCHDSPCENGGECIASSADPTKYVCRCRGGYGGTRCELEDDSCFDNPCKNGGTCVPQIGGHKCYCPMGFGGHECRQRLEIGYDVSLSGDGFVQLSSALMPHNELEREETFSVEFSTSSPDGVLLWHGQTPDEDLDSQDFLSLAVVGGHLELRYEMGSGEAELRSPERVDDGRRHAVTVKRAGTNSTVKLDSRTLRTRSQGELKQLNTKGNIYIGGMPDIERMTGRRHFNGFLGCIHRLRLPDTADIEFESLALNSVNVVPCSNRDWSVEDELTGNRRGEVVN